MAAKSHKRSVRDATIPVVILPFTSLRPSASEERTSFIDDIQDRPGYAIPEIDALPFVEHLLPPLRAGIDADSVVSSLRRSGVVARGRWKAFRRGPSTVKRKTANDVFAPLVDIFNKIANIARTKAPGLKQLFKLTAAPECSECCTSLAHIAQEVFGGAV